jgi:hypothetical protein
MCARHLHAKGASLRQIARELDISPATAMRDLRADRFLSRPPLPCCHTALYDQEACARTVLQA